MITVMGPTGHTGGKALAGTLCSLVIMVGLLVLGCETTVVSSNPRQVIVKYGQPLDFAQLRAEAKTCSKERLKQIYQEVANEIMLEISRLEPVEEKTNFAT